MRYQEGQWFRWSSSGLQELVPGSLRVMAFRLQEVMGSLLNCWWECKLVQPLWRTVWRFLQKLRIALPYYPAFLFLCTYPEKTKTLIQKDTCTPVFIAALFTIAKTWKQSKYPPTDE